MKIDKGIVLAEVGNREKELTSFVEDIRTVTKLPIVIYSDRDYPKLNNNGVVVKFLKSTQLSLWKGHSRWANRQNDYFKIWAAKKEFRLALILDDDMRIVSTDFHEGFELAKQFGFCLPVNPRVYYGFDEMVGADVDKSVKIVNSDIPFHLTGINMGTIFVDTEHHGASYVIDYYLEYMKKYPCRGPVAMSAAYWRKHISPYFLPEEWCVCGGYTQFKVRTHQKIKPIILHVGHDDVMKWYRTEPAFKQFRKE